MVSSEAKEKDEGLDLFVCSSTFDDGVGDAELVVGIGIAVEVVPVVVVFWVVFGILEGDVAVVDY